MKLTNHKSSLIHFFKKKALARFSILFALIFCFELVSEFYIQSNPALHYLAKPMVLSSLAAFFYWQCRGFKTVQDVWIFMGLILSLFGDIFLMFPGNLWFMLGLGSFLFGHVSYIFGFWKIQESLDGDGPKRLISRRPWTLIPFILYGLLLIWAIYPGLGGLAIPVYIYATVIMVMAVTALNRWRGVSLYSFGLVFLGALLFILSDSVLAMNKFAADRFPIPLVDYWIMITYMTAQYLIVMGILAQKWQPKPLVSGMN